MTDTAAADPHNAGQPNTEQPDAAHPNAEHPLHQQMMQRDTDGPPAPGKPLPLPLPEFFHFGDADVHGDFRVDEEGVGIVAVVTPGAAHEGAIGLVHGGVLSALCDHVFGQASTMQGMPAVTRELVMTFLRPTYIGQPIEIRARATSDDGRDIQVEGTCTQDGRVVATATGHFVRVSLERILNPTKRDPSSD